MDSGCSCENVATTGPKLGGEQFRVWELLAHRSRAERELSGEVLPSLSFSIGTFQQETVTR